MTRPDRSKASSSQTARFDWGSSLAPVKNTFIHYDISNWSSFASGFTRRGCSSPAVLLKHQLSGKLSGNVRPRYGLLDPDGPKNQVPEELPPTFGGEGLLSPHQGSSQDQQSGERMSSESEAGRRRQLQRHEEGDCKPCVYFHVKEDGCRLGDNCQFCHICTREDVKEKKRQLKRRSRAARREAKRSDEEAYQTEDEGQWQDTWASRLGAFVSGYGMTSPTSATSAAGQSNGSSQEEPGGFCWREPTFAQST